MSYAKELNKISQLRRYDAPYKNFKTDKLLRIEKDIYDNEKLSPIIEFSIPVTLYCSTLNGRIYSDKKEIFSRVAVLDILQQLRNKNGVYFNDRYIWDSICRVERGRVSNKMRFSIYERDRHRCRICGVSDRYASLEIDHIIPIARGGKSTYDNLQTLCHKCNVEKGSSMPYGMHM